VEVEVVPDHLGVLLVLRALADIATSEAAIAELPLRAQSRAQNDAALVPTAGARRGQVLAAALHELVLELEGGRGGGGLGARGAQLYLSVFMSINIQLNNPMLSVPDDNNILSLSNDVTSN